jgi:BirA family biotin operon repressor/biotin-[acetyl-CoA-carboxylase] ligase
MSQRAEWNLATNRLGRRVLVFDQLDSTNTFAAGLADDPNNDGLAVVADVQTLGRGQHGRTWTAAPRSSVLLSLLLFPPEALRRAAILTAWAAVSVCELAARLTGALPRIKWPNDVFVHGRKVCGILIEQGRGTVVGVGLNVQQEERDFAVADLPQAASLTMFTAAALDTESVARELLMTLDATYMPLLDGDMTALEEKWQKYLGLFGCDVTIECHDGPKRGRLRDVSFARVVLEQPDGTLVVPPEKVLHISTGEPTTPILNSGPPFRTLSS